jgi:DNA-binding MarR family transcriptional regulator
MGDSTIETSFHEVLAAQKVLLRELARITMPHWMHLDLSMGQVRTLAALASHQPMNVSALAEKLGVSKPSASILVDQLVQRELAERTEDPDDRRRTLLALSSAGNDLVAELRQLAPPDRMIRWLEAMDPDDLAALKRGTQALADVIQRDVAQSSSTAP